MKKTKKSMYLIVTLAVCLFAGCGRNTATVQKNGETNLNVQNTGENEESETKETDEKGNNTEASFMDEDSDKNKTASADSENPVRIFCWGDSLTYGEGGEDVNYPSVLCELSGCTVYNYGVQGEVARQIGIRMGVYEMTTSEFTIPEDSTPVSLGLVCEGEDPVMFRLGTAGLNPCEIAGVRGTLSYQAEDGLYYFTRTEAGEAVSVQADTKVVSHASEHKPDANDIVILFAGTNDRPSLADTDALIKRQKEMISYLGSERYIVIGLTCKDMVPQVQEVNEVLRDTYGEHFYDAREYFLRQGLEDAGITASTQDLTDIENGEIPSSLRVDVVHGTDVFYRLLGEQIYAKLQQQGYL